MMNEAMFIEPIFSYGALGAVAAYFMWKDWKISKELNQTLGDFRVVMELIKEKVGLYE